LTDQATLKEIETLREQILRLKGDRVPIVVVGTKSDLPDERQVDREQMMNISLGWGASSFPLFPFFLTYLLVVFYVVSVGVPIYETSAKKNWHVTDAFDDLLRQMRARYPVVTRSSKGKSRKPREESRYVLHPPSHLLLAPSPPHSSILVLMDSP
jgi:GTPase SAR1 family protein